MRQSGSRWSSGCPCGTVVLEVQHPCACLYVLQILREPYESNVSMEMKSVVTGCDAETERASEGERYVC